MRKVILLVVLLATGLVAGCGGGGGTSNLSVRSSDNKVTVTALPDAWPKTATLVLTPKLATDFVPPLATAPGTGAFVAAASFTGYTSNFTTPATISWTLSTALAQGTAVELFTSVRSTVDNQDHLTDTGTSAVISSNGLTVSAPITACGNYVLLKG